MIFSDETLSILKNYATINPSLIFNPGNTLKTISPMKTIMSEVTIAETFEKQACIYDLSRFLATLSLFATPELEFHDKWVTISDGRRTTRYTYADPSMVVAPPNKSIKLPDPDVVVSVTWNDIASVTKASSVLQLPEIAFVGDGSNVSLQAIDSSNPTADKYDVVVGSTDKTFKMIIKTENLKLLPLDYDVSLSSKGMASFSTNKVNYYIVIEQNSEFQGE